MDDMAHHTYRPVSLHIPSLCVSTLWYKKETLNSTEMKLKDKVIQVDLTSKAFPLLVHWLDWDETVKIGANQQVSHAVIL